MQDEVASVKVPEAINELFDDIKCELSRLDIQITDRKYINYSPIVRAKAWLCGRDTVETTDLSVLQYYLWTKLDDIPKIQQVLDKYCLNPLHEKLAEIISLAEENYKEFISNIAADPNNSNAMRELRKELVQVYRMITKLEITAADTEDEIAIKKAVNILEDMSEEAHDKTGFTCAPLSELEKMIY
jgi:MoxR-like ATPase